MTRPAPPTTDPEIQTPCAADGAAPANETPLNPRVVRPAWLLAALIFVLSRAYLLLVYVPVASDATLYFEYALRGVDGRQTPFRDFSIEYPPLAWWVMALPRAIAGDGRPVTVENAREQYDRYMTGLHAELVVFDLAALVLFLLTVRRRRPAWIAPAALCYAACTALFWHLLYERLDVGLLALLMAWAWAWTRSLAGTRWATAWAAAAYLALGAGAAYKLIPLVMLPFAALAEAVAGRGIRQWLALASAAALGLLGPFAVHWPSAGPKTLDFLDYHRDRGMEVASLVASLVMQGKGAGWTMSTYFANQSFNLAVPGSPLPALAGILPLLFLAVCGLWVLLDGRGYTRQRAYVWMAYVAGGSIIFSKVLSPQYFIWGLPLMLLAGLELFDGRRLTRLLVLLPVVAGLTTWIYPYLFFSGPVSEVIGGQPNWWGLVPDLHWPARTVLLLRNLLYLTLVAWLGAHLVAPGVASPGSTMAAQPQA